MMVEEVKAFKTTDGKLHETVLEATRHQASIDFNEYYEDNYPLGNLCGSYVDLHEMRDWLIKSKKQVLALLEGR